jgi:hypothetical protein
MSGLTPKQEHALSLILARKTGREAAEACGVDERTVSRWRRLPAFQEAMEERLREITAAGVGRLRAGVDDAIQVYLDCVADKSADWKDRLKAADAILDRVGISPTTRVEVSGGDPLARLREILGVTAAPENRETEPEGA